MAAKKITIFGSALPREGTKEYQLAYQLGILLTRSGFDLITGGGTGIMDAVSKGAAEAGGKPKGIVLPGMAANAHVAEVVVCGSLLERVQQLIEQADGYVVLRGGTGTMLELAALWEYMNKDIMPWKPTVCHSTHWESIVGIMDLQMAREQRQINRLKCLGSIEEGVQYLKDQLYPGEQS